MTDAAPPDRRRQLEAAREGWPTPGRARGRRGQAAAAQSRGAAALSFNQPTPPPPIPEAPPAPEPPVELAQSVAIEPGIATSSASSTGDQDAGPLGAAQVEGIRAGYAFEGPALELGALLNGEPRPDVPVRIPIGMLNRHGLVAGATGTGKTRPSPRSSSSPPRASGLRGRHQGHLSGWRRRAPATSCCPHRVDRAG